MLESIAKKTKGILPILWIVQQLCLCFLLCNMLHMHQDSEETRPSVSLNRHGSDPCHEKHLDHFFIFQKNSLHLKMANFSSLKRSIFTSRKILREIHKKLHNLKMRGGASSPD